jgi:hypothetical protein
MKDAALQIGVNAPFPFYGVNWLRRGGVDQYRGRCPIHRGQAQSTCSSGTRLPETQ